MPGSTAGRPYLAPEAVGSIEPLRKRPTFAVITAIYQGADVIAANAEAILGGTQPPDEYIICDDGSTDDLAQALAPFADRITLIQKANGGAASAYNVAMRAATSDFVVQTDHDDTFFPERLQAMAELAMARPDLDVIATDALMELDGDPVARYNELTPFSADAQRAVALEYCFFGWPAIRRERLTAIGGFNERLRIVWDWDCWIRLILDGCLVGLVDEPLYRWRLTPDSLSSDVAKNYREGLTVLDEMRSRPDITADERRIIDRGIRMRTRRIALLEAKGALLDGRDDARSKALDVALGRYQSLPSRLKAGLAVVSPRAARHFLGRGLIASTKDDVSLADR